MIHKYVVWYFVGYRWYKSRVKNGRKNFEIPALLLRNPESAGKFEVIISPSNFAKAKFQMKMLFSKYTIMMSSKLFVISFFCF